MMGDLQVKTAVEEGDGVVADDVGGGSELPVRERLDRSKVRRGSRKVR